MRAVLQRVLNAELKVDGKEISKIEKGLVIFFGVGSGDKESDCEKLALKISKLRIFEDDNGKMNLSLKDKGGEILLVSQFTLYGDCSHGNRPSFIEAEKPERANNLYKYMQKCLQNQEINVKMGVFGADMKINVLNYGPVTILLDSKQI